MIQGAISGGGVDALGIRADLMSEAVDSWIKHPILGWGSKNLDAHSLILSTLANNGIVGLFCFLFIFYYSYKIIVAVLRKKNINPSLFRVVCVYILVLAFLNPIGYVFEVTIVGFFIVPIVQIIVGEEKEMIKI